MTKYLENGQMVELVEKVKDGYLVKRWYTCDCNEFEGDCVCEDRLGDTIFVNQVFNSPPVETLYSEVKKLKEEISKLHEEEAKISNTIMAEKNRIETQLNKLKKYEGLQLIEDYIDGNITHFVTLDYYGRYPEILTAGEKLRYKENGSWKTRLLALYGDKDGDLEWRLHYYSDGSGNHEIVYPFTSYSEALEKAHEELAKILESIEKERAGGEKYYVHTLVDVAEKYKFPMPEWAIKERANSKKKETLEKISALEMKKVEADEEIKKLMEQ